MEIHIIEKTIVDKLKKGEIPSISDFGNVDYLFEHIEIISNSKFSPELVALLLKSFLSFDKIDKVKAEKIILKALNNCNDEFVIRNLIDALDDNKLESFPELEEICFEYYLKQATNLTKNPITRAWLLEAAFRSSLRKNSRRFKLIALLVDISATDNNLYLTYVSNILGLAYSIWQEKEIKEKLQEIRNAQKGTDEVYFELGMCYLLDALESTTEEIAFSNFVTAKEFFKESILLNEVRPDAEVYENIISILLSLNNSNPTINIQESITKVKKALTIYNAWQNTYKKNDRINARNTEMANWYLLVDKLENLFHHLNEPSWFEPKVVIETYLINIYTASRSILKRDKLGGLEKIIQPKIQASLIQKSNHLYAFEKWLKSQENEELREISKDLKREMETNKDEIIELTLKTTPLSQILEKQDLSRFKIFINNYKIHQSREIPIKIEQIFDDCANILNSNKDYQKKEINFFFNIILFLSLRFLKSRMDATRSNFPSLKYLFKQESNPKEDLLQDDYHNFMTGSLCDASISLEKSDVASGRVDVYFSKGNLNISAEIKRDWTDCSFEALRKNYLGQASEYSNTDIKLGFLIVLDLTPKPNGIRSIESSVKVEIVIKKEDPIERHIVVIVVPGMKETPSNIKAESYQIL